MGGCSGALLTAGAAAVVSRFAAAAVVSRFVACLSSCSPANAHMQLVHSALLSSPAVDFESCVASPLQLYDIEIDRINKPYLPLAAGDFSVPTGWALVVATGAASLAIGAGEGLCEGRADGASPCLPLHDPTNSTRNIGRLTQADVQVFVLAPPAAYQKQNNDTHTAALVHTSPSRPAASGSLPLLATLGGSLLLGLAYSTDLPLLRWKRSPVLAAACILAVRCALKFGDAGWCCDRGRQDLVVADVSQQGYRGCVCALLSCWIQGCKPSSFLPPFTHCHWFAITLSTLQGGAGAAGLLLSHAASAGVGRAGHHAAHRLCHRLHAAVQVKKLGRSCCIGLGFIVSLPCRCESRSCRGA